VNYIEELKDIIRQLHGADVTHVKSVPVKEAFRGKPVWEGVVEVFDLIDHPKASRFYAWAHDTGNPEKPRRHVTVLHLYPIQSARDAVKAAIVQEFRSLEPAEKE
jgi:aminoglycoside phosphotransferase (APT) family kinase protein